MRSRIFSITALLFLLTTLAFAENPPEGGISGQNDNTSSCQECSRDLEFAYCDATGDFQAQRWADCKGGQICYWSGSRWYCEPDCGGTRCYIV